ncbi:MAG: hypothetical protein K9L59_05550 [Desulfobacterales bacterium]|nr:hypothetical protein [Desulfobacterales bacterium]MCF8080082.1 hypothetical protein [Desulfobacterales bacterium]
MTIQKARVRAKAAENPKAVVLTLVEDDQGWTYSVDGVTGGDFLLAWRETSAEKASESLLRSFPGEAFTLEIVEEE